MITWRACTTTMLHVWLLDKGASRVGLEQADVLILGWYP